MNRKNGKARPQTSNRAMSSAVARGESRGLTGGTNDVKPETLSFAAVQSGQDVTTTTTQALPVLRNFQTGGGRAQLVEILKVWCEIRNVAEVDSLITAYLSTKNFGATATTFSEPSVFAGFNLDYRITTTGATMTPGIQCVDLTDGDGNGVLVATDNIYAQIISGASAATNTVRFKILYRIYGASVTEYVGIVQSQQ